MNFHNQNIDHFAISICMFAKTKKMKILVEYQYLPPVYLFSALYKFRHIIFEEYEFYQKMSFRNRCVLAGAEGPVQLSIPVSRGRNQKTLITEVQVANRYNWQLQHWKTIESCYRSAPWFEYYGPGLEKFYNTPYTHLIKWNLELFLWIVDKLGLKTEIDFTQDFQALYPENKFVDVRNTILPKTYMNMSSKPYQQVFSDRAGFYHNLSIIDLLLCQGKGAVEYLKGIV